MAVGDQEPVPLAIDQRVVGNRDPRPGEAHQRAPGEIKTKDAGMLQVANEKRASPIERQTQGKSFCRRDLLDGGCVRGDPQDLSVFAAGPDPAVWPDRYALRMLQSRCREESVE